MVLKILQTILVTASICIPLLFWHGVFFPHTFIKTSLFYLLVEIMAVFWIPLVILKKDLRPPQSGILVMGTVFLGALILSSFAGVHTGRSFWSGYERMFGVWTWIHGVLFLAMMSSILRTASQWQRMFWSIAATASVVSLFGIWQGITTSDLSISTIGNAAYLSLYAVDAFFIALLLFFQEKTFSSRSMFALVSLVVLLGVLPFTEARAGVVGLAAGIVTVIILFLLLADRRGTTYAVPHALLKKIVGGALGVMMVCGLMVIFFPQTFLPLLPESFQGLLDFNREERTASGRLLVWSVAWEGWKDRFMLGWGPENFDILFNTYYNPVLYPQEPWFDRAHNFIFDIGSTAGLVGLLLYVSIYGAAITSLYRKWQQGIVSQWSMTALIGMIAAHLTQSLFTFESLSSFLLVLTVLAYSVSAKESDEKNTRDGFYLMRDKKLAVGVLVMMVVIIPIAFITIIKPLLANRAGHNGWEALRLAKGDAEAISYFEKGIAYNTYGSVDLRRFAAEYVFEFLKQGGTRPPESLQRLMGYAVEKMTENIASEPENVKWYMYRGELYNVMAGKFNSAFAKNAEEDFTKARAMSLGRPQIYLELAYSRKLQGDLDSAWNYIDHAAAIAPDFSFVHLNAAVLAVETGERAREETEIAWMRARDGLNAEPLRDAYYKTGRFRDAAAIQQEIVSHMEREPYAYPLEMRVVNYQRLAALYQKAGDKDRARVTALNVLTLDPRLKNEVEAFLNTL